MDLYPHSSGASGEERIGKPLFVIVKGDGDNRDLMVYCQPEGPIFKRIKHYGFIIRDSSFREDTDAGAFIESLLRSIKNCLSALLVFPVYQNAGPLIEKTEKGDLCQFLLTDKNERILHTHQHQHNVGHRGVICHQHIALILLQPLGSLHPGEESHSEENNGSPEPGEEVERRVPFFPGRKQQQEREEHDYRNSHQDVKPDTPQEEEELSQVFHTVKNSEMIEGIL